MVSPQCEVTDIAHATGNPEIQSRLEAVRGTSTALIKDPPEMHFQRRVCDPEDFAFELAEATGFCDRVCALQARFQKPDFGNAFGNVILAALSELREKVVTDDRNAQERDSRRRCFQVELLAK